MRRNALLITYMCIIGVFLLLLNHPAIAIRVVPNQNQNPPSESDASRRRLEQDVHRHLKKKSSSSSSSSSSTPPTTPTSPDDHLVTSLPLLNANALTTAHWAGLLPASPDQDKYLFYWLFAPDTTTDEGTTKPKEEDIPLIIWLNGGPGCSSMDGLFLENGPLRFELVEGESNTYQLTTTPFSWHQSPAYVVYIDQPVGTGLSYTTSGKYPGNDEQVDEDFYYFLQEFVQLHADKFLTTTTSGSERRSLRRSLYFTGESHAGHYIPSMMAYILQQNDNATSKKVLLPLAGAAIGNGWVDPRYQYAAAHAAYGHGFIGMAQRNALDQDEETCRKAVEENWPVTFPPTNRQLELHDEQEQPSSLSQQQPRQLVDTSICFSLLDNVVSDTQRNYKVSQYDVRMWESKNKARSFPPGHKIVEAYLGQGRAAQFPASYSNEKVLQAIHATASRDAGQVYEECTDPPYNALAHQDGMGVVPEVVQVLEYGKGSDDDDKKKKVRLLFFNGIYDLICNHVGNEIFLEKMPWSHRDDWVKAARYAWRAKNIKDDSPYANSMVSGYYKAYENLAFLKVMDSGHMVPMDVPDVALDMIRTFVYHQEFEQYQQGLGRSLTAPQCEACPECPAPSSSTTPKENNTNKTNASSSDQQSQETNELGRFVIAHAWMGAILGVVVFGMAILCKRQQHRRIDVVPQYSLELQSNPPNNGINVANVTYRDQDPSSFDDEDDDDEDDVVDYEGGGGGAEFQYKNELPTNGHGGQRGRTSSTPKTKPTII